MATTQVVPYLFFGGRCEQALEFYKGALGAQIDFVMRYDQSPEPVPPGNLPEGFENKVMHSTFRIGETKLHAADGNTASSSVSAFFLSLPGEAEVSAAVVALSEGGEVTMPVGETFWSPCFGMVTDRFGIDWMISVPTEENP